MIQARIADGENTNNETMARKQKSGNCVSTYKNYRFQAFLAPCATKMSFCRRKVQITSFRVHYFYAIPTLSLKNGKSLLDVFGLLKGKLTIINVIITQVNVEIIGPKKKQILFPNF